MSIARDPRPEAKRAAEQVAYALDVSDPTEIAEIIEASIVRVEMDPDEPVVDEHWADLDPQLGISVVSLVEMTDVDFAAGALPHHESAARNAAIQIARRYPSQIQAQSGEPDLYDALRDLLALIPPVIERQLGAATWQARTADVEDAMRQVQAHRRRLGMPPLAAGPAGWSEEDVLLEAQRIARLPNPLDVAPGDPVLAEMSAELEAALLEQDLRTVDEVLAAADDFYGADARETRALHVLVRSYGVLANPSVAELKRRLMP